jgi:competence protein ComEC
MRGRAGPQAGSPRLGHVDLLGGPLGPVNLALLAWVGGVAGGYRWTAPQPARVAVALALSGAAMLALAAAVRVMSFDLGGSRPPWLAACATVAAIAAIGLAWGIGHRHVAGPHTVDGYLGRRVTLAASVSSAAASASGGEYLRLDVHRLDVGDAQIGVSGEVLADTAFPQLLEDGDQVMAAGRLTALRRIGPTGEGGYADRLERQGVFATLAQAQVVPVSPGGWSPASALARLRRAVLAQMSARFPGPEAAILAGLVVGGRARLPPNVLGDLQDSGLAHLLAVSGLKIIIVAGILEAVLRPLPRWPRAALTILGLGLYTALGGTTASALRAALMAGLAIVARALGRETDAVRSLLLAAATMLTLSPALGVDAGFQFSFLGVLGIQIFTSPIHRLLPSLIPATLREAAAVTVGAQALTFPLSAHYFDVIPLLAPVANGLAVPVLPVAMLAGMLATAAGALGDGLGGFGGHLLAPVAATSGSLAVLIVRAMLAVAHITARLPGAIHTPGFGTLAGVAYYAGLAIATVGGRRGVRPWFWAPAAGVASLAVLVAGSRPDGRLHVSFLAGISGPAVVVRAPDGASLLVDGGSAASALGPALAAALPAGWPPPGLGRRLDAVVLTGSSKPEAGATAALGELVPRLIAVPALDDGEAAVAAAEATQARGAVVLRLAPDQTLLWHGLRLSLRDAGPTSLLEMDWRAHRFLVGYGGTAKDPAQPPPGTFDAIAMGARAPDPVILPAVGWLVIQDGGSRVPTRLPSYTTVGRTWRTSQDGGLDLECDPSRCDGPP